MLYIRTDNQDGVINLTPITNNNIYLHCNRCGKMIRVIDLLDYIAEIGEADFDAEIHNICDECLEEQCEREDEYVKTHHHLEK
ncbi:MAG TPA: hypothetical protein DIC60_04575 [Lachnospiraceae bacterium]|nr:hypothetical protein [Lachnospiraceae bacterium]